jgi:hypothetical protein
LSDTVTQRTYIHVQVFGYFPVCLSKGNAVQDIYFGSGKKIPGKMKFIGKNSRRRK